jgi:periplasmic protein TonB
MGARTVYRPKPEELELPEALRHRTLDMVAVARFFHVGTDGNARVELVEPTSDPDLNRALIAWLRRFRFFPGLQDGKPIGSSVDIRVPISVR